MDNQYNLLELLKSYPDDKKKRQKIFVALDCDMKKQHKDGNRIVSFDPRDVRITWTNHSDVHFRFCEPFTSSGVQSIEATLLMKERDIHTFAILCFCSYLSYYDFEQAPQPLLNAQVVKENFEDNVHFLPEEDVPYLRSVLVDQQYSYYSDYRSKLNTSSLPAIDSSSEYGTSRTLSKSTPMGRALTGNDINEQGRIPFFLLVSVTAMLTLIASLTFIYLYQRIG